MSAYTIDFAGMEEMLSDIPYDLRQVFENTVISPLDLVQRERFIKEQERNGNLGPATPVDIIIFGYDEPEDRDATKIGGLPYWPSDRPWPVSKTGQPLEFLAQINFSGSMDICPPVPAPLLSIFIESDWCSIESYSYFWQKPVENPQLISATDIPEVKYPKVAGTVYGANCRTRDFSNAESLPGKPPITQGAELLTMRGTKIGGIPKFFHGEIPDKPGRYLCTIHSLRHPVNRPWPFLDVSDPLTPEMLGGIGVNGGRGCHDTVMFASQGSLFLYIEDNGTVHEELQCW
jgi:hypothetical protein